MGQDIRKMFGDEKEENSHALPKGHVKRFEKKLDIALPQEEIRDFMWRKLAAIFVVVLGTSMFFYFQNPDEEVQIADTATETEIKTENPEVEKTFSLSDISPEYKRVEDYYMASINVEISKLNITDKNKELIDSFMKQLSTLDEEYKTLNKELAVAGINEQTLEALVDNLKLRLELLLKLKQKLKELNQLENEQFKSNNG